MFRVPALDVDLLLAEILLDPSFFGLTLLREPNPLLRLDVLLGNDVLALEHHLV